MSGVNKVILLGRLGADPQVAYTTTGLAVVRFSLATSKKPKGGGTEVTAWHRCVALGSAGETIARYKSKGQLLHVEGELEYGSYEKGGVTHYTTDVKVREFDFVG